MTMGGVGKGVGRACVPKTITINTIIYTTNTTSPKMDTFAIELEWSQRGLVF